MSDASDCAAVRRHCARLLTLTESTVNSLSSQEAGTLQSVLRKCVLTLAVFVVQTPTNAQVSAFNTDIRHFIQSRCPNVGICDASLWELSVFVRKVIRLQCQEDPEYKAGLRELRHMETHERIYNAVRLNRKITTRIQLAIFHELLPTLHKQYGFRDMVAFVRAFRREDYHHSDGLPLPLIQSIEFSIDDTEAEYQGVGERVQLSAFCKPAGSVPKGTECSVCVTEIDGTENNDDEQPVSTKCGHTFHKLCLDNWVNDSGMKASNTCPSCRTVLCDPRERLHTSMEAPFVTGADDENDSSYTDGSSIESVVTVPLRPRVRVQWLETRITAHLNLGTDTFGDDSLSDTDESSLESSDSEESITPQSIFEILRAERHSRVRVIDR